MKNQNFIFLSLLLYVGCGYNYLSAKLNNFGISDIIPTHDDDKGILEA